MTVATRQGVFALPLAGDDPISRSLYVYRNFELDLVSDAMELIRSLGAAAPGTGTVIDVGANNGVISIGMLVAGELDRAVAIEPDPGNFSLLRHNVERNGLENAIACVNCAATDGKATLRFELSEGNLGDHRVRKSSGGSPELFGESGRQVIDVPGDTLDNLLAGVERRFREDVSVVWIDVQGHEGYVFQGGRGLLSTGVPVVAEIWPYGIRRSGMSRETFCDIVTGMWSAFWVRHEGRFVRQPMEAFGSYFDGLGYEGDSDNVVLAK